MEVFTTIMNRWGNERKLCVEGLNKWQSQLQNAEYQISVQNNEAGKIEVKYEDQKRTLAEIQRFIEMIGLEKDQVPLPEAVLDSEGMQQVENKKCEILQNEESIKKEIQMRQNYLTIWDYLKSPIKVEEITNIRKSAELILAEYENAIDLFILQEQAQKAFETHGGEKYDHNAYKTVLPIFNEDSLRQYGRTENYDIWTDGTAGMLMAVCRANWELEYLIHLKDRIIFLENESKRKELKKLIRKERKSFLMNSFKQDIQIIDQYPNKQHWIYESYRSNVSKDDEESILEFIKAF